MKTTQLISTAAIVFATLGVTTAHAGGFLADTFIRPFSPDAADAADRLNHQFGNPVDHSIAAGANVIVPGSGAVLEGGWAIQRSGILNPRRQSAPRGTPIRQVAMTTGNFCVTPAGRFGPGPMNALGSPCYVRTQFGTVVGHIGG